jgi:hypothetical protein
VEIELLVEGEVYLAVEGNASDGTENLYNIFYGNGQKEDDYIGGLIPFTDINILQPNTVSEEVWGKIHLALENSINDLYRTIEDEGVIPEITPPIPDFGEGGVEDIDSCIRSTEYVVSTSMSDIQVMLARVLKNHQTIMVTLKKLIDKAS